MGKLSYTQKLYAVAVLPEGRFPFKRRIKIRNAIMLSCLIELAEGGYIRSNRMDNTLRACGNYSLRNNYLGYVYDYISQMEKFPVEKLVSNFFTKNPSAESFLHVLNRSLYEKGHAFKVNEWLYVVQEQARKDIIVEIRENYLKRTDLDDEEIVYAALLNKCDLLKECFDCYEIDIIQNSLLHLQNVDCNELFEVINKVDFSADLPARTIAGIVYCFQKENRN